MDPYTQVALALINLFTEIVKSQPPEVKAEIWKWYVEDMRRWRKFFKIDED